MGLLILIISSAAILAASYRLYGSLLARLLKLDPHVRPPAEEFRDDNDYVPIEPKFLLSQHFSAIAAAGPIVGPILAAAMFGWLPAVIWILAGSILIGGVHDMGSLVASIRHKARSIPEVVRLYMSQRSYILFLVFIWIALIYIIVAFTDVVAGSFAARSVEGSMNIPRGSIATSSLIYLALPILMGLLLRYTKISLNTATLIFLPLVGISVWVGQYMPLDLTVLFGGDTPENVAKATKTWDVILLVYCFVASLVPMWLLLQPRGHLGGYFLYVALGGSMLGLIVGALTGAHSIEYPAFIPWDAADPKAVPLFPVLFITIACGACSGFHSIIASGTTSKQLRRETDARVIGYGAMLLEAMVAIVSVTCVMIFAKEAIQKRGNPNLIYADGLSSFLAVLGVPPSFGFLFGLLAFTTFVYDTLDVCTRLGRYIIQELTGWKSTAGGVLATALTAFVPLIFVTVTIVGADGKPVPAWRHFWHLFGASNQLLAALALLGITVWLWRTYRAAWVWLVAGVPTVFMYAMSTWALAQFISKGMRTENGMSDPVPWVAIVLVSLAALVLLEAVRVFLGSPPQQPTESAAQPVAAA